MAHRQGNALSSSCLRGSGAKTFICKGLVSLRLRFLMNGGPTRYEFLPTVREELGTDDDLVCIFCVEVSTVGGTEKMWYAETTGSH